MKKVWERFGYVGENSYLCSELRRVEKGWKGKLKGS